MRASDEAIVRLAEAPAAYEAIGVGEHRIADDRYVLFIARGDNPGFNTVQHLRLSPQTIDATVDQVRAIARAHGRTDLTWEISSSATPPDLTERLRERGMTAADPPAPW